MTLSTTRYQLALSDHAEAEFARNGVGPVELLFVRYSMEPHAYLTRAEQADVKSRNAASFLFDHATLTPYTLGMDGVA